MSHIHTTMDLKSKNFGKMRSTRVGIMLHDDGSATDIGCVGWFQHPDCHVSYNYVVLRSGDVVQIVPHTSRAWHAGKCMPNEVFSNKADYKDANSAFIGVATAATKGEGLTPEQRKALFTLCVEIFDREDWPLEDTWRLTGHKDQAWPRGRKDDPYNYKVMEVVEHFNHILLLKGGLAGASS